MYILIVNAGSSSEKLAIYSIEKMPSNSPQNPLWEGSSDWQDTRVILKTKKAGETLVETSLENLDHSQTIQWLLKNAQKSGVISSLATIAVVGHRIVHGGDHFQAPLKITPAVKEALTALIPLAPLHNPANLKGIAITESLIPHATQVAVFDTAFHTSIPEYAHTYAGPYIWKEEGIRRYGFHGINHQYCVERCGFILNAKTKDFKIVTCHLGNGASLAAILNDQSVDTTMGFTPVEGMMMGSRTGSIDPSILLFLAQQKGKSIEDLVHILNFESGLKGICGTNDMREVMERMAKGDEKANLAYQMYVHSLKRNLGAMIAVLGGIDILIFTAGIGENVYQIREEACQALSQLGLKLDSTQNRLCQPDALISDPESKVKVLVLKAQEDWCIARACCQLCPPEKALAAQHSYWRKMMKRFFILGIWLLILLTLGVVYFFFPEVYWHIFHYPGPGSPYINPPSGTIWVL